MQKVTKHMAFGKEARSKLFEGVKLLADAVTTTLSPKGRNVAFLRQWGVPLVVHDGVTVAKETDSSDPLIKVGVDLVKEAAESTNLAVGDGTTTSTLFAYELLKGGLKLIDEGINPMILRNQIYKALPSLLDELKTLSRPVKDVKDIERVAFISSTDSEIGKLVSEAMHKVGKDGLVTVDEGTGVETEVDYTDGMEFNKGYLSQYFVTNVNRMEAVVVNPVIALVEKKITLNPEIVPILEALAKESKDMIIIAHEISGDALATMAANKMKGNINAVAIECPGAGDLKGEYLADIATLTGGKVISNQSGIDVSQEDRSWVGRAERVVCDRSKTMIVGGKGDKKEIEKRIADLRELKENEKNKYEKEKIEERLAKLSKGVAVIRVAGKTEIDMREKIERVKDAIGAATAARDEGVVVGGGSVFLQMSKVLKGDNEGEKLLKEVLESVARKIMFNCGEPNEVINANISRILASKSEEGLGYEVESGDMVCMYDKGIIDPAKVCRLALENALAVGSAILTTDVVIGLEEKNEKDN